MKEAVDAKRRTFKELRRDRTAHTEATKYTAIKRARQVVASTMKEKEAIYKLIDEMEAHESLRTIFKITKQA